MDREKVFKEDFIFNIKNKMGDKYMDYKYDFTDIVNVTKAKYIYNLTLEEFKFKFWKDSEVDENGRSYKLKTFYNLVRKFCGEVIRNKIDDKDYALINRKYRYSNGKNGRIFVNGFGVQSLQGNLRKFLTGDYLFDQSMMGKYKTDIGKLAYIGKKKVLCMLGSSIYAEKEGYTAPKHRITPLLKKVFTNSESRIIFTVFESDIYRIQELLNQISLNDRKVVIMGKSLSHTISKAIDLGYIDFEKIRIGKLSNLDDKKIVVLTSNERQRPYSAIERIVNGYDKYIKLKETDTVILGEAPILGYEKKCASVMDGIAKIGADSINISSKKYLLPQASKEDIMLMLNLINPRYYMPVGSEYRYQYANSLVAMKYGMKDENIILAKNGDIIDIEDGKLLPITKSLKVGELLIDGNRSDDIGALVIRDREMLSKDGIVIVTASIDKHTKKLLLGPEVITRGFIYVKNNADIIEESKKISKQIILEHTEVNRIDFNKVKNGIRDKLGKYLYKETKCNPMIITVLSDI